MLRYKDVRIRKFEERDIPKKVEWINNPENNRYLHYDLPLTIEGTKQWYDRIKDRTDRFDAVIEYEGIPVGLIGLLGIDRRNMKAEGYWVLGEHNFLRKGITTKAHALLSAYTFRDLGLNRLFYYIEVPNVPCVALFRKMGFKEEGILQDDVKRGDDYYGRYVFAEFAKDFKPDENMYDED